MEGNVVGMIIMFVVVAIVLSIGLTILGNTSAGFDCKDLEGYNAGGADDAAKYPDGTWAGICHANSEIVMSSYAIISISLIVIGAVVILVILRMF